MGDSLTEKYHYKPKQLYNVLPLVERGSSYTFPSL